MACGELGRDNSIDRVRELTASRKKGIYMEDINTQFV